MVWRLDWLDDVAILSVGFPAKKISKIIMLSFNMFDIELIFLKVLLPTVPAFVLRRTREFVKDIRFNIGIISSYKELDW